MYDDINDLTPENKNKRKKHKELLNQLHEIEDSDFSSESSISNFLPSSMLKENNKSSDNKEKNNDDEDYKDADEWFSALMAGSNCRKPHGGKGKDLFASAGIGKKKKKKKKKKDEFTDYSKEFEPEIALYRNLLQDQNRFTDTLQKEYDAMKSTKSSARGVNKTMTDLIENINGARSLAMQLVEKNVNAKKLIAELTIKEKKEFGNSNSEASDMNNFASNYLKQMINERQTLINGGGDNADISDCNEDELFESLSMSLGDTDRSEDVDKYLKYENRNVSVYAYVNTTDVEDYEYIAKDENGEVIDDYPLPNHTSLSVNRSTNIATDAYGKKYPIIWK